MPRLGVLLVRAGAVTEDSVQRALAVQGFTGGRIGTLLLERGSVSEDDVGKALAEQHGCEYIPWRALGAVQPSVAAALPAKFAIRHSAVPVEVGEGYICVVLRDPANLRILDELFFVTGKKIVPAAAPEVRIFQALERCYGERRTPRFAILAEKLSRPSLPPVIKKSLPPPPDFSEPGSRPLGAPPSPPPPGQEEPPPQQTWKVPDLPAVGWGGLPPPLEESEDAELESIPWEELPGPSARPSPPAPERPDRRGPPPASPVPQTPRASPWRETSLPKAPPSGAPGGVPPQRELAAILAARDRDAIFDAALRAMARRFRASAVFVARPEGAVGRVGAGERVDVEALRGLEIPWAEPSIFLNVRMSRSFYLGPLPPLPRHDELAAALGGWPAECIVQPVLMRDKVVAFLYAECVGAQAATPADLTYLRELAGAAAASLAASIRLKKKQVI